MTERIYYRDPFQLEFEAHVVEVAPAREQLAVVLDRTAFYPTSGGQIFDTGRLLFSGRRANVIEVTEREQDGAVVHFLTPDAADLLAALAPGVAVRGEIDADRRRDHMQQHTGQHVLSAAFERLFELPTVSFHMGRNEAEAEAACTIDLETSALTRKQATEAERLANQIIWEDRPVEIRFTSLEEARALGLRKLPERAGEIRLIDIRDFDLCACGGTHVRHTGQIGAALIRKTEKVRQGVRVEFVCGLRAVAAARRDYETLSDAAAVFSTHMHELPAQARKALDEAKAAGKREHKLGEQLAEFEAARLLRAAESRGAHKFIRASYAERDANYIKLLAQKIVAVKPGEAPALALLASTSGQPALVLAQSPGLPFDCGALLKQALTAVGGRGGGSKDLAQGGVAEAEKLAAVMDSLDQKMEKA